MNLKLIKPKTSADLAASIAETSTTLAATEARRQGLLAALDAAVLNGTGEDAAEAAVTMLDAELARLRIRLGAYERGHAEAAAREESQRVAALEAEAHDLVAKHDKAAKAYDSAARDTVLRAKELDALAEEVHMASRAIEIAGGTPPECALAAHVLRGISLPASHWHADNHR